MKNPLLPKCQDCGVQEDFTHDDDCMYQWTPLHTQYDGTRRDYYRALYENDQLREDLTDGFPSDWFKQPWNTHHFIDMFKEVCAETPWLAGHAWGFQTVLTVGLYAAWMYERLN